MPKLRYLKVRFAQPIFPYDIPKFRAAVIEKTARKAELFHNHKDDKQVFYRYPLIQYKVTQKKASIICLESGTDEIHHLLQHRDMQLRIGNQTHSFEVEDVDLHYHQVQTWTSEFEYSLLNWLALNQKHLQRWQALEGNETAQIDLLQSILKGNILAFAKGIDWWIADQVTLTITQIKQIKPLTFKRKDLLAFSINFKTNVSLPNYVGLGKGSSIGFGIVKLINEKNSQ
ncbi:MAG: CRISPR-associated endonuclease Cas6 [Saprospiraceae bacterium]